MPKKKNETYGFDVGGEWVYPEGKTQSSYGAPRRNAPTSGREYGNAQTRKADAARADAQRESRQRNAASGQGARGQAVTRGASGQGAAGQGQGQSAASLAGRRASDGRTVLSERQRQLYEKAYREKYGRSPYEGQSNNPGSAGRDGSAYSQYGYNAGDSVKKTIREDRRGAFLREEEEKRREAERRAREAEEQRRRAAQKAAREAEEKRRREIDRRRLEAARKAEARRRLEAERAKAERRRRRRHAFRVFRFHVKIAAVTCIAAACLLAWAGYNRFWNNPEDFSGKVTYYYGGEKASGASGALAYRGGKMRVNFSKTAEYFGFPVSGDSKSMKYIMSVGNASDSAGNGEEQSIEFFIGSETAVINGTPVRLAAPSEYADGSLWVASDIMSYFSKGVDFEVISDAKASFSKVKILDANGNAVRDGDGNYVYEKAELVYKSAFVPELIDLNAVYGEATGTFGQASDVTFVSDLSEYERYMNPADSSEYLILVNKQNTVDADYVPADLCDIADTRQDGRNTQKMREYAAKALEALFIEMRACGYTDVSVTSAYRSYEYQSQLFNTYLGQETEKGYSEEDARERVLTYSAYPGTSEHQTGLCCDMHNLGSASTAFAEKEAYKWLTENAWKFGFILRFPEDKTDITGYSFEPWHYRFVGRYAAEQIHNEGLCLEEYLDKYGT